MKAEDLMIGDWVNETYEAVDGNMYEQEKRVGYYDLNDVKYFTPIPITPEILKKNGFVKCKDSIYYQWDLDSFQNGTIGCFYTGASWKFSITSNISSPIRKIDGMFKYVHELQHALKLCGIDKEIIL